MIDETGREKRPWRRCRDVNEINDGEDLDGLGVLRFGGCMSFFRLADDRPGGEIGARTSKSQSKSLFFLKCLLLAI